MTDHTSSDNVSDNLYLINFVFILLLSEAKNTRDKEIPAWTTIFRTNRTYLAWESGQSARSGVRMKSTFLEVKHLNQSVKPNV